MFRLPRECGDLVSVRYLSIKTTALETSSELQEDSRCLGKDGLCIKRTVLRGIEDLFGTRLTLCR